MFPFALGCVAHRCGLLLRVTGRCTRHDFCCRVVFVRCAEHVELVQGDSEPPHLRFSIPGGVGRGHGIVVTRDTFKSSDRCTFDYDVPRILRCSPVPTQGVRGRVVALAFDLGAVQHILGCRGCLQGQMIVVGLNFGASVSDISVNLANGSPVAFELKEPHRKLLCTIPEGPCLQTVILTVGNQNVTFEAPYQRAYHPLCCSHGSLSCCGVVTALRVICLHLPGPVVGSWAPSELYVDAPDRVVVTGRNFGHNAAAIRVDIVGITETLPPQAAVADEPRASSILRRHATPHRRASEGVRDGVFVSAASASAVPAPAPATLFRLPYACDDITLDEPHTKLSFRVPYTALPSGWTSGSLRVQVTVAHEAAAVCPEVMVMHSMPIVEAAATVAPTIDDSVSVSEST